MEKKGLLKVIGIILAIVVAVILCFFAFKISAQRKAIDAETRVEKYFEDIKVAERNRVDSLQSLADSVKSYAKLEESIFTNIANARRSIESGNFKDVDTDVKTVISAIAEAYPTLQSSELYKQYNIEVATCNRDIEIARKTYNSGVRDYKKILRDPITGFFLSMSNYEAVEFATISDELGDNTQMPVINWD